MVEDGGAVLVPVVAKLPVLLRRVDVMPEHVEQLLIAHLFWVVHHLYRFRMAGTAGRRLLLGMCEPRHSHDSEHSKKAESTLDIERRHAFLLRSCRSM